MNETYKKRFHTMEDQIRLLFEKVRPIVSPETMPVIVKA